MNLKADGGGSNPLARRGGHPDHVEDALLEDGLRRGSDEAFLALVQQHQGAMLRIARHHVASAASAEDVVQDTWIAILSGIAAFDGRSSLKTWMYKILTNRAKTLGTRERRSTTDSEAVERQMQACDPAVPADRFLNELDGPWPGHWRQPPFDWERNLTATSMPSVLQAVNDAIVTLPANQALVLELRDIECWTADDVCNVLGLSQSNQRVLLHRARSKVRLHLELHFRDTHEIAT